MSPEAAILGLLSAFRATPLALVYGFLLARPARRLLTAYTVAGAVVSLGAGIAVVTWFDASAASQGSTTTREVVDLVVGIGALCYAGGYWSGQVSSAPRRRSAAGGALRDRLRHPTVAVAASTGALTNLPGLLYIAGLVAILETRPSPVGAVVQVLIYTALRFAVPIAALIAVALRPARTRQVTESVYAWGQRHQRALVVGVFGAVGLYLTVKGLGGLLH